MNFGACPIPVSDYPVVTLAHGGGGRLTRQLIDRLFRSAFDNAWMVEQLDGAILELPAGERTVFTTDSFVVSPLFFPGGDIGKLAVCGTVNDLAMCGAVPRYLSCALVIEEGFAMESLWRVVSSMARTAQEAGVVIVTGDTKVVARGQADGLFVNTAGVGSVTPAQAVRPSSIRPGDAILINGDLGRHGLAIMATREGLEFENSVASDCAPLNGQTRALLDAGLEVHGLRDLTRGGFATSCVELCAPGLGFHLEETAIPVEDVVRGGCELLGLDPLYVANEGRFALFLPAEEADRALEILRATAPPGVRPARVGEVTTGRGQVRLASVTGSERMLDILSGEQLPRIC